MRLVGREPQRRDLLALGSRRSYRSRGTVAIAGTLAISPSLWALLSAERRRVQDPVDVAAASPRGLHGGREAVDGGRGQVGDHGVAEVLQQPPRACRAKSGLAPGFTCRS